MCTRKCLWRLGAVDGLGAGVIGKYELPKCVSWEPGTGHQKEQQVFLTAEPSPQPATCEILIIKTHFVNVPYAHLYFIRKRIKLPPSPCQEPFLALLGELFFNILENEQIHQDSTKH